MLVTKKDESFIKNYFPDLKFENNSNKLYLRGNLKLAVSFDKYSKKYKIFSKQPLNKPKGYLIEDSYEIEIELSAENVYRHVRELGNKIVVHPDYHKYPNGFLCVAGYLDEIQESDFRYFFCEIVIPFFYDQSCFKKYGFWPRPGFSHGFLGILENYRFKILKPKFDKYDLTGLCLEELKKILEKGKKNTFLNVVQGKHALSKAQESISMLEDKYKYILKLLESKKIADNVLCLECNDWFKKCHKTAFKGLKLLKQKIKHFNIKIEQ